MLNKGRSTNHKLRKRHIIFGSGVLLIIILALISRQLKLLPEQLLLAAEICCFFLAGLLTFSIARFRNEVSSAKSAVMRSITFAMTAGVFALLVAAFRLTEMDRTPILLADIAAFIAAWLSGWMWYIFSMNTAQKVVIPDDAYESTNEATPGTLTAFNEKLHSPRPNTPDHELQETLSRQRSDFERQVHQELDKFRKERWQQVVDDIKKEEQILRSKQRIELEKSLSVEQSDLRKQRLKEFEQQISQEHAELADNLRRELEISLAIEHDEIKSKYEKDFQENLKTVERNFEEQRRRLVREEVEKQKGELQEARTQFAERLRVEQENNLIAQKKLFESELEKHKESARKQQAALEEQFSKENEKIKNTKLQQLKKDLLHEETKIREQQKLTEEQQQSQYLDRNKEKLEAFEIALIEEQHKIRKLRKESFEKEIAIEQESARKKQKKLLEAELEEYRLKLEEHKESLKKAIIVSTESQSNNNKVRTDEYLVPDRISSDQNWIPTLANLRPVILLNGVTLYLKLAIQRDSPVEKTFVYGAPLEMQLGDYFNHFINVKLREHKNEIAVADSKDVLYEWQFFKKGVLFTKQLDPQLTLSQNKIQETSVIIAKRI